MSVANERRLKKELSRTECNRSRSWKILLNEEVSRENTGGDAKAWREGDRRRESASEW
jgi:hypothetical protein